MLRSRMLRAYVPWQPTNMLETACHNHMLQYPEGASALSSAAHASAVHVCTCVVACNGRRAVASRARTHVSISTVTLCCLHYSYLAPAASCRDSVSSHHSNYLHPLVTMQAVNVSAGPSQLCTIYLYLFLLSMLAACTHCKNASSIYIAHSLYTSCGSWGDSNHSRANSPFCRQQPSTYH